MGVTGPHAGDSALREILWSCREMGSGGLTRSGDPRSWTRPRRDARLAADGVVGWRAPRRSWWVTAGLAPHNGGGGVPAAARDVTGGGPAVRPREVSRRAPGHRARPQ